MVGKVLIQKRSFIPERRFFIKTLTLVGLGLIKINDVSANFNNPRPLLILKFGYSKKATKFEKII